MSSLTASSLGVEERRLELLRRWRVVWKDPRTQAFWKNMTLLDTSYMVGMLSWFVLFLIEAPLWFPDGLPLFYHLPGRWLLGLALLAPIQGWLVDRYIELKTSGPRRVPFRWRAWRFALASFPLLGLYALPAWRQVLARRPGWIVAEAYSNGTDFVLRPSRKVFAATERALLASAVFPFLIVTVHFGLPPLWASWLSEQPAGPGRLPFLVGLHLQVAACFAHVFAEEARKIDRRSWRRTLLRGLPVLFLLGLPGMVLGFAAFRLLDPLVSSGRPLVWSCYARQKSLRNESGPMGLQDWLGSGKKRWSRRSGRLSRNQPEKGQAEMSRRSLYRLKTFLLSVDVLALAWVALSLDPSQERIDLTYLVMKGAAGIAVVGLVLQTAGSIGRLLGGNRVSRLLDDHPYGHFLFVYPVAVIVGLAIGAAIGLGLLENAGNLISQAAACCGVAAGYLLMMGRSEARHPMLWPLLFMALIPVGVPIVAADDLSPLLPWVLGGAVIANFGVGVALGGWLLRPYQWRDLLNPGLPLRKRWALAFLAAGALLPFGGLLVPCWIFLRQRSGLEWERTRWSDAARPDPGRLQQPSRS